VLFRSTRATLEVPDYFGWIFDQQDQPVGYVCANFYGVDGSVQAATVARSIRTLQPFVTTKGDVAVWRRVAETYMTPEFMPHQFVLAMSAATPFLAVSAIKEGLPIISLESPGGGAGKSTLARVAASMWMRPGKIEASQSDTKISRYSRVQIMRHVINVFDEVTNVSAEDMASLIYDIANRKGRTRATVNGGLTVSADIYPMVVMTSNVPLRDKVEEAMKSLQDAAGSRLMEIRLRKNDALEVQLRGGEDVFALINTHYGTAGDLIMRWSVGADDGVQKLERIRVMIAEELSAVQTACSSTTDERFYMHALAVAMVGARIGNEVGIWGIDVDALRNWACTALINDQRSQRISRSESPLVHLAEFVNSDLQTIVTARVARHMIETLDASGQPTLKRGLRRVLYSERIPTAERFRGRAVHALIEHFHDDIKSTIPGGVDRVVPAEARMLVSRLALRDYLRERNCSLDTFEQEALAKRCMIPYRGEDNMSAPVPRPRVMLADYYLDSAPRVDVMVFDTAHPALAGTTTANGT
jgi:hypothetical protein